ncbi:MAG: hypothetical protein E7656_04925 [Ruminococcaceae bacterium]|nr:hypothetical protein [Oscillospiraceae bacterium]
MVKEKKEKKTGRIPLWAKIILGILLGIIALFVIAMVVIWIISPDLFMFIITFVIPNLPKLLTANNMKAAWIVFTSSNDAIVEQIEVNQQNKSETLGVSPEVLEAIESGKYTAEEIAIILDTKGEAIAEIDAAKLAASEKIDEDIENADGVDDIMSELSSEVIAAIESGRYTEDEIALIIESKGDALAQIDAEKEQKEQTKPPIEPAVDAQKPAPDESQTVHSGNGGESANVNITTPPAVQQPQTAPEHATPVTPTQPATPDVPPVTEGNNQQTPTEIAPQPVPAVNVGEIVNKHVAKLYILKNRFVSELASLEKKIKTQYSSLPKDQRVPTSRKEIAKQYISFVSSLELECDAEVDGILADLKAELTKAGGDVAIVDTVRSQYEEEKSLKKAYYLDVYMNGLPASERADTKEKQNTPDAE